MLRSVVRLLSEHYSLLSILIGIVFVSVTLGPFHNMDSHLEYSAAQGVIKWGMPYQSTVGKLINQPPFGFYTEALYFKGLGMSYDIGVALITLFGLASTTLVYALGKMLYSKSTGIFAAALFALTPWQLALSRSFLIDGQCLFLSLSSLYLGIIALQKGSFRLFMVSATLFSLAFLTKFFALFTLIPLALFFFYSRPKSLIRTVKWMAAFFLPMILFVSVWYQGILGRGILNIFNHDDFNNFNSHGVVASYFFVGDFLLEAVGSLFLVAAALSLALTFLRRDLFSKILFFDLTCLITVIVIVGINTFLGAGLNLSSPYFNPVKYDYQALPFFSLLAASLIWKSIKLVSSAGTKNTVKKAVVFSFAFCCLILIAFALFFNMTLAYRFSTWHYLLFRVEFNNYVGYFFVNSSPIGKYSPLMAVQYVGYAFVFSGLLWASRHKLGWLRKQLHRNSLSKTSVLTGK
jgi:4-amino-4-deoxy-L-arabinose transferase-like glycosyltransferase